MPYSVSKKEKCIYKKKADNSRGEKVGCTKGSVDTYLKALYANVKDTKPAKKQSKK